MESSLEHLLFSTSQLQELASNVLANEYLSKLTAFGLSQIREEPERVHREEQNLEREMQDLSWNNYKTFIDSADCTQFIKGQVSDLSSGVPTALSHLDDLSSTCQETAGISRKLLVKRKENNLTLQQHTTLLEFLEIPQMMDTCIKNQCYEEALELQEFSKKLEREHSAIPAIKLIAREVDNITQTMVNQLHSQLCSQCSLSDVFQVTGYLQRLSVYRDYELRVVYLHCREEYMEYTLSLLPPGNNFLWLSKMIDTTAMCVQEIVGHYNTVFPAATDKETANILPLWCFYIINKFISHLRKELNAVEDGTFLPSIASSSMHFGKTMARLGCDFRGMLVPLFEGVIIRIFQNSLRNAENTFGLHLRKYSVLTEHVGLSSFTPAPDPSEQLPAPVVLLDYPPLALLTNAVLSTFNDLRTCWLFSIQDRTSKIFRQFFKTLTAKLSEYKTQAYNTKSEKERKLFTDMCKIFGDEVIPYLVKCFNKIFATSRNLVNVPKLQSSVCILYAEKL